MIYWQSEKCDVRVHVHVHETPAQRTHEIFMDNGSPRATASNCSSEPAPAHKEHKYSTSSLSLLSLSSLCQLKRTSMKAGGRSDGGGHHSRSRLGYSSRVKKNLLQPQHSKWGSWFFIVPEKLHQCGGNLKQTFRNVLSALYPILSGFLSCSNPLSSVLTIAWYWFDSMSPTELQNNFAFQP